MLHYFTTRALLFVACGHQLVVWGTCLSNPRTLFRDLQTHRFAPRKPTPAAFPWAPCMGVPKPPLPKLGQQAASASSKGDCSLASVPDTSRAREATRNSAERNRWSAVCFWVHLVKRQMAALNYVNVPRIFLQKGTCNQSTTERQCSSLALNCTLPQNPQRIEPSTFILV